MRIDGELYVQVIEKHYKSCSGCHFEAPEKGDNQCVLPSVDRPVNCESMIWVKFKS